MAEKNRVSGRTALVTGGAKGIGGEITRILADKGYTVVIAYNTSGEAAGSGEPAGDRTGKPARDSGGDICGTGGVAGGDGSGARVGAGRGPGP